jgi:hypothetical protein
MNYQNGKIYRIDCLTTNEVYIGSTCQPTLAKRLAQHITHLKCWKNGKSNFTTSFQIIERNNYKISLIELFPCNSKDELTAREGHFIRTITCINKTIIGRTQKEYRETHKEEIKDYQKDYSKDYYETHKDIIKNRANEFYEKNKEKIKEYRNEKFACECGGTYITANKERHFKTKKHLSLIPEQILSVETP